MKLAEIWQEVLGREKVSVEANFFETGGHSLKAIQVISRIYKVFGVKIELRSLFEHPTIATLSREIEQAESGRYEPIPLVVESSDYALSHAQKRLWITEQQSAQQSAYNISFRLPF